MNLPNTELNLDSLFKEALSVYAETMPPEDGWEQIVAQLQAAPTPSHWRKLWDWLRTISLPPPLAFTMLALNGPEFSGFCYPALFVSPTPRRTIMEIRLAR
ncbi:MAG: hypothetical protein JW981_03345 [Anaerolineae bacterium]|nr:hypothetical protein [Anaerolineae bacterium]